MFNLAATTKSLDDGTPIERGFGFFVETVGGQKAIYNTGDLYTHTRYIYFPGVDRLVAFNTSHTIEHYDYLPSEVYLHFIGKVIDQAKFRFFDDDVDLTDL